MDSEPGRLVELLGQLIRNRCVSSGWPSHGEEARNVSDLSAALEGPGLEVDVVEPVPGRPSLIARIDGSDPDAPSLCLLGHTDVVPADPAGWSFDPFGGEVVGGEVRGRGAVDMLNQTAAMALTLRRLADEGFRPRGSVVYWAVPDEECGGHQGARLVLEGWPELVRSTATITEVGGARIDTPRGPIVEAYPAEKGSGGLAITVRGTSGHTSLPYQHRNAVVIAAEVIRRIDSWEPTVRVSAPWRSWVQSRYEPGVVRDALLDAAHIDETIAALPADEAAHAHACTRCTVSPTIIQGGDKINTFADTVRIGVNIRPIWGDHPDAIIDELRALLSDLVAPDDIAIPAMTVATRSPTDTDLWRVLEAVTLQLGHGARLVPSVLAAQTDARWLRPTGMATYGFGLLSPAVTRTEYWSRFHSVDERIDTDSLALSLSAYDAVVRRFCGGRG
jgi:acetylornithine deacetylase/succinyl-diaminopimelate desuccinylase-like protein